MADNQIIQLFPTIFCLIVYILFLSKGVSGATFTLTNKCDFTVWPGILTGSGSSNLGSTGFELPKGISQSFQAPTGWSGRFWGRTGCDFDAPSGGSCATGDCGSGKVECDGAGATPPATLAEFTLGSGSQDFYDVSLVDGYNLPMMVEVSGGSGHCAATGCVTDLNTRCPTELRVEGGGACRSACDAFGTPEYCCSGEYNTPAACKPSMYSEIFKSACPRSYSYAYDDTTSTFTCTAADYTITFCPNSPGLKPSEVTPSTPTSNDEPPSTTVQGGSNGNGSDPEPEPEPMQIGALAGSSLLANLATGESSSTTHQYWNWIHFLYTLLIVATNSIFLLSRY